MPISDASWTSQISGVFDRACSTYDTLGGEFFGPVGARLVEQVGLRGGHTVLDLGSGLGASLIPAGHAVGPTGSVTGIDISPKMVEALNRRIAAAGLHHAYAMLGDAGNPELPDSSIDAIVAGFVIFFLEDPIRALRRYTRILRQQGLIAMTVKTNRIPATQKAIKLSLDTALTPFFPTRSNPCQIQPTTELPRSSAALAAVLDTIGFVDIQIIDEVLPATFESPHQYWEWLWSHGARQRVESIPVPLRGAARAAALDALSPHRNRFGQIECAMPVRYVTARAADRPLS